jgi:hypothetical protein
MRARLLVVAVFAVSGCQLERLRPGSVGAGVARLSVRQAAVLTSALAEDAECGFKSAKVLGRPVVEGVTGQPGAVTWTVRRCALDFGAGRVVSTDCRGVETAISGRAVLEATRRVEGTLTGDPQNPVVPTRPDAVVITQRLVGAEGLSVKRSDSTSALTVNGGELSWVARPALAVGAETGLCTASTTELTLEALSWRAGDVVVDSAGRSFAVEVNDALLSAQLGRGPGGENALAGSVTVWGAPVSLPVAGEPTGLDPAYDAATFVEAYACRGDLKQPVDRACPSVRDRVVQGAAQLTVAAFGAIASAVDDDARCGFASPAALSGARLQGAVGGPGSVTFEVPACELRWPVATAVKTDCHGVSRVLEGVVVVSGRKTVQGLLTGDPQAPVIPTSRDAATVSLSVRFEGLTSSERGPGASSRALHVARGTLRGALGSRLALDVSTGACSIKTPVVFFRDLTWDDAQVEVRSGASSFPLVLTSSRLDAQAGAREDAVNRLEGSLTVDGVAHPVPVEGPPVLDPSFDAGRFTASYACLPNLALPADDAACAFTVPLAQSAARLVVQTAGAVAALVNRDSSCGFESTLSRLNPTRVVGAPGERGEMTFLVQGCALRPGAGAVLDRSCLGAERRVSGQATVTGSRTVSGERETRLLVVQSIIPRAHDAVSLALAPVTLSQFAAWTQPPGQPAPAPRLTIHEGSLAVVMRPILGESAREPGRFDVPTPVAAFDTITLTQARATLQSGAKTFTLELPRVELTAQAGAFRGQRNTVSGTVQLGAQTVTLSGLPLDPAFDQSAFDRGYACTEDLRAVVQP